MEIRNSNQVNVVLKDGAKIYSTDDSFNQQILASKTLLKNSDFSYKKSKNNVRSLLVITKKLVEVKKNLSNQLIAAQDKIRKSDLKKLQKEIKKHEKLKFPHVDFNSVPVPGGFFSSNVSSKNYITPSSSYSNTDFSQLYISSEIYSANISFLHSQNYIYYNNKSLSNSFVEVFSARPPPVFVVI